MLYQREGEASTPKKLRRRLKRRLRGEGQSHLFASRVRRAQEAPTRVRHASGRAVSPGPLKRPLPVVLRTGSDPARLSSLRARPPRPPLGLRTNHLRSWARYGLGAGVYARPLFFTGARPLGVPPPGKSPPGGSGGAGPPASKKRVIVAFSFAQAPSLHWAYIPHIGQRRGLGLPQKQARFAGLSLNKGPVGVQAVPSGR